MAISIFFLLVVSLGCVFAGPYNGFCTFTIGQNQTIDIIAGSNIAFFYVFKINNANYYDTSLAINFFDTLINSSAPGANLVGDPGVGIYVATREDNRVLSDGPSYFTIFPLNNSNVFFSNQVTYFGIRFQNLLTTTPLSFAFSIQADTLNGNSYFTPSIPCSVDSGTNTITCSSGISEFTPSGFDVSQVNYLSYTIAPVCATTTGYHTSSALTTSSQSCVGMNGYMRCVSSTQFQTCSNGQWATPQSCQTGTYCTPNGNYIYCGYTNPTGSSGSTTTTSSNAVTTQPLTTQPLTTKPLSTQALTSGALTTAPTTGVAPTTCTVGNTKCTGTNTYETCVYVFSSGGYVGGWGSDQNCPAGTTCVQYSTYIGCS